MDDSPYRLATREPDPYERAWARARWIKRAERGVAAGWGLFCVTLVFGRIMPWPGVSVVVALMNAVAAILVSRGWRRLACPRCGKRLFVGPSQRWPFGKLRCQHCGVLEGTSKRLTERSGSPPPVGG